MFYGYIRVSTDEQSLGAEAQRLAVRRFASQQGVAVDGWFEDIGVSGGADIEQCPGLVSAIRSVQRGWTLCVAKRDRLAREVLKASTAEAMVAARGGRIVSCDGVGNTLDAAGSLARHIMDAFSEFERQCIRDRTKRAMAVKKSRGERVGNWFIGHEPAEKKAMELASSLHNQGCSLRNISDYLHEVGLDNRNGTPYKPSSVRNLIRANKEVVSHEMV